jgi:hypothetical protein
LRLTEIAARDKAPGAHKSQFGQKKICRAIELWYRLQGKPLKARKTLESVGKLSFSIAAY